MYASLPPTETANYLKQKQYDVTRGDIRLGNIFVSAFDIWVWNVLPLSLSLSLRCVLQRSKIKIVLIAFSLSISMNAAQKSERINGSTE